MQEHKETVESGDAIVLDPEPETQEEYTAWEPGAVGVSGEIWKKVA